MGCQRREEIGADYSPLGEALKSGVAGMGPLGGRGLAVAFLGKEGKVLILGGLSSVAVVMNWTPEQ